VQTSTIIIEALITLRCDPVNMLLLVNFFFLSFSSSLGYEEEK
jgi:hypothetical protein